jgi:uncharacterized cupin superfamily protein
MVMESKLLQQDLCENFCAYYRPGKDETLACLGYLLLQWLQERDTQISFEKRDRALSPSGAEVLLDNVCRICPFFSGDCDYVLHKEGAVPCGGFVLLGHLFDEGAISIDDIRNFALNFKMPMHIYDVSEAAMKKGGEFILGSAELHTHACYLGYGVLKPGETGREIRPGKGHEEIVCLVSGEAGIRTSAGRIRLAAGQAFHISGDESLLMDNDGDKEAVYVIAGGHSGPHGDH